MTALDYSHRIFLALLATALVLVLAGWVAIEVVKALIRGWKTRRGARW